MNVISQNLLSFIKNSPSPFHVVSSIEKILNREGFEKLDETKPFGIEKGKKYYLIKNGSSIIAFKIGEKLDNYSFNIVASHSDSPALKVKPNSDIDALGYHNINVETYGGLLASTWFDRPLSIAGRVMVYNNDNIEQKLVSFEKNLLSIPSMPIHFNREANNGYKYNFAVDMFPTMGQEKKPLKEMVAEKLGVQLNHIINYDLFVYNSQDGYFWGNEEEFISSSKLDDLQCAYTTLMGFVKSSNEHNVQVYCCFDNEEVGSLTLQGARSRLLDNTLKRISLSLKKKEEEHLSALSKSFVISADNAHATHPNHPELVDPVSRVYMNKGIVIKFNASQSYSSDSFSSSIFMKICDKVDVPYQIFTNKSGTPGGGTLGNLSIGQVSVNTVDIGLAQLAMHSSFETAGTKDNEYMLLAIKEFYDSYLSYENGNVTICK